MLPESEYVRFRFDMIPPKIIEHYGLDRFVQNSYVYARINKAWYGLKQAGKIAHDDLVKHLAKHGYVKAKHTQGLFTHVKHNISFMLVVDDFGIKHVNKEDIQHLILVMQKKYKFKVDFKAEQYIGIHINWDYDKRELRCCMKGYVEQALKELEHIPSNKWHQVSPSQCNRQNFGAAIQYAHNDDGEPLPKTCIQYIQRVVGKFLYYARAIDNTMLHALNDIASVMSKGTTTTATAVQHLLDYARCNPDAEITYRASEMTLHTDSDAVYLVVPEA